MTEICCFTGHRDPDDLNYALMDRVLLNLAEGGCKKFLCGMARGFDLAAAESVIQIIKTHPALGVKLVACVPCAEQSHSYSQSEKRRYERIISECSEVICLSEHYYEGCMFVRDRFMVDNSDTVLCFLRKKSGGTYYTVRYAEKLEKKVIAL